MKIYNIKPSESLIKWTSNIGDHEIHGVMNARGGKLISELDRVVEGNVEIDLSTMKVTDSSLEESDRKRLEETLKSTPLTNGDNSIVNYQFSEVRPDENHDLIKGLLTVSEMAFGIDVIARFEAINSRIRANGKVQVQSSNPVLIHELDHLYDQQLEDEGSFKSLDIECELIAVSTDN